MKINKRKNNEAIMKMSEKYAIHAVKLAMENLVMPRFEQLSWLFYAVFNQVIVTKEQPQGCAYNKDDYNLVIRIIDGKVLFDGRPDAYAWNRSKVELSKSRPCGLGSYEAQVNMENFLESINDLNERELMKEFITLFRRDFLLVRTEEEERTVLEVTQELYDAGLTSVVDSWMETDENGDAEETLLNVGDFLVINKDKGTAYCIRGQEFRMTHRIG